MPMIRVALRLDRDSRDWMGNRGIDARPRHFERPPFMSGIYPREGDHRNARHNALLVSRHIVIRGDPLDVGRAEGHPYVANLSMQIGGSSVIFPRCLFAVVARRENAETVTKLRVA